MIYVHCCESCKDQFIQYTTFCCYWRTLLPFIVVGKPMSDLCWQCQQNSNLIMKAVNRSAREKTAAIKAAEEHITAVTVERSYYRSVCKSSCDELERTFTIDGLCRLPPPGAMILPMSHNMTCHYSFDMAQQVHYPFNPLQPGPIYFLTPRKCAIFGVNCESVPRQVCMCMHSICFYVLCMYYTCVRTMFICMHLLVCTCTVCILLVCVSYAYMYAFYLCACAIHN